jgi:hypothetical protein
MSEKAVSTCFLPIDIGYSSQGGMGVPGIAFTVGKQSDSILREHLFRQVIGICGICRNLTSFRQIDRQLPESIQVMFASGSESKFHGYSTRNNYHMDFGSHRTNNVWIRNVLRIFSYDNPAICDTDIMTNAYRKTVDAIMVWRFNSFTAYPV